MFSTPRWTFLLPAVLLLALSAAAGACGGSDDDSDGQSDSNADSTKETTGSQDGKKGGALPKIADGAYSKGTIHVEITGDKRATFDTAGNGFAQSGVLLLTYADAETSSFLTFSPDEPGGMVVTTKQLSTAAAWGAGCDFTIDKAGADKVSGEFECKGIEAIDPGAAKVYRVTLKGKFSVER